MTQPKDYQDTIQKGLDKIKEHSASPEYGHVSLPTPINIQDIMHQYETHLERYKKALGVARFTLEEFSARSCDMMDCKSCDAHEALHTIEEILGQ